MLKLKQGFFCLSFARAVFSLFGALHSLTKNVKLTIRQHERCLEESKSNTKNKARATFRPSLPLARWRSFSPKTRPPPARAKSSLLGIPYQAVGRHPVCTSRPLAHAVGVMAGRVIVVVVVMERQREARVGVRETMWCRLWVGGLILRRRGCRALTGEGAGSLRAESPALGAGAGVVA